MVDRISNLSDELLCHILSFLPTEQAAPTCVLSKRWISLFTWVPILDYDDQIYLRDHNKPSSSFERFVYASILAKNAKQPITSFRLKYKADANNDRPNSDVNVWVNTALQRGVENLDIEMFPENFMIMLSSRRIFSCRTLVALKLKGLSLNSCSSVELPSLKSLHVENVKFVEPQYLMELLYGCPMLEDLKAESLDYVPRGVSIRKEGVKILPKLVRANLRYVGLKGIDFLLKAVRNVEFLKIAEFLVKGVPKFPHLRHLDLFLVHVKVGLALKMLKKCPKLQSFEYHRFFDSRDVLPYTLCVPECLTSCLTKCSFNLKRGREGDLQFAKYIMQNSTSLQLMRIRSLSTDLQEKHELLKELALCPRKSVSCKLSFD